MSLPPERISVKRRRQEEPVETLILEHGSAPDKKRQFTDFFFQRLRTGKSAPTTPQGQSKSQSSSHIQTGRDYAALGIPTVRTSVPGDDVRDLQAYKDVQNRSRTNQNGVLNPEDTSQNKATGEDKIKTNAILGNALTRHFHLTRDISSLLKPNSAGGIRRSKISLRPPLATFVERQSGRHKIKEGSVHQRTPVDRIVGLKKNSLFPSGDKSKTDEQLTEKIQVETFVKSSSSVPQKSNSIRDDPATWDQESDILANELAALAFDIDPNGAAEPPSVLPATGTESHDPGVQAMILDGEDEFIFETYVRVKYDSNTSSTPIEPSAKIGVLVIDDENEDLWEKYIQSDDDDDEWDQEDEDSNAEDNPRNEYPDDEVSSDDEYGRNIYQYRHNGSDTEEYDQERNIW